MKLWAMSWLNKTSGKIGLLLTYLRDDEAMSYELAQQDIR